MITALTMFGFLGLVTTIAGSGTQSSVDGLGTAATFYLPLGIEYATNGKIYIADDNNNQIRSMTTAGLVQTVAGSGSAGSANGIGTAATFYSPRELTVDTASNIYVVDYTGCRVRKVATSGMKASFICFQMFACLIFLSKVWCPRSLDLATLTMPMVTELPPVSIYPWEFSLILLV